MAQYLRWPDLDPLLHRADALASGWESRARAALTVGGARAVLRLFGVEGLDREGRPLAAAVANRAFASDPGRLAGGIALPFAIALVEYEATAQDLALDIAAGNIDLALESELLADPRQRSVGEAKARELRSAALARIDATRLVRRDLREVLGDPGRPWVALDLDAPHLDLAREEARGRVMDGADVIRVRVPPVRELAERLVDARLEPRYEWWRWSERRSPTDPVPAGAQRGLAVLREAVDEAATERGRYTRLMTSTGPLASPEQAVVAAFEGIDIVEADPVREIVEGRVDPERALADHAFAHRLIDRSGAHLLVSAGPLLVGRDLARGVPSDPASRAGAAFALQLVAVALARHGGIPAERIVAGAVPDWIMSEPGPATQSFAQASLRRAALPDLGLAFVEPDLDRSTIGQWPLVLVAGLLGAGSERPALVVRQAGPHDTATTVRATGESAAMADYLWRASGVSELSGDALDAIAGTVEQALAVLERLIAEGWSAVVDTAPAAETFRRTSGSGVVMQTEPFDPLG